MPLSNEWNTANEIYKPSIKMRDFSRRIYRQKDGFEAFVIDEKEDSFRIEGNGVKCWIWKHTSKTRIFNVASDYKLRK